MSEVTTELRVEDVYPNPRHYREVRDADVKTLAASIVVVGQLEPITVFQDGDIYVVDSGHHRLAAMKSLGLETIKAIVLEDIDEAKSAQVMVASNLHFPESELEISRGTQLLLSTGVRPVDAAALIGEKNTNRIEKVKRGLAIAKDYAEDMSLDRLEVLPEFEGDQESIEKILKAPEANWRYTYNSLRDNKIRKENLAKAEEIVRAAGVELIKQNTLAQHHYLTRGDQAPEGAKYARITTFAWNTSAEITWYDDASDQKEDPEEAARREREALIKVELEKAAERRLNFLAECLDFDPDAKATALIEFAKSQWESGTWADADSISESLAHLVGFPSRVYASILSRIEDHAASALRDSQGWYGGRYSSETLDYFEALDELGFQPTDVENGAIAEIEELLAQQSEADDEGDDDA
jgi:ParB-like chromosome segregation protein Spo0J